MQHKRMSTIMLTSTILGALCGIFFPEQMLAIRWVDSLFVSVLKVVVIPLIFFSIVSAIISMGTVKCLKSIWIFTTIYILISMVVAVIVGLVLSNIFQPGFGMPSTHIMWKSVTYSPKSIEVSLFIHNLFPPALLNAAAKVEIMPIVFFSIVFGIACVAVGKSAQPVVSFFIGMRNIFNKIIAWLIYISPFALFGLLGSAIADAYNNNTLLSNLRGMSLFIGIFTLGLFIQFIWQAIIIKYILRRDIKHFISNATSALMMAFATSSSLSTLPISLLVAKNQQVKDEVANFSLPFSALINLGGTAMYEAISALFFCQVLGIHLSIIEQIGVFFTAILAGIGAAGIPEGGLITMAIVLRSVNVPTSAVAVLLPFDRLLDRLRTVVNVWGDLVCTTTVNHLIIHKGIKNPVARKKHAFNVSYGVKPISYET